MLARGRTAEAAQLIDPLTDEFISRKTASVHVSNILRQLGVSTRVQAAALAERAGLARTS
jgi:regulatory LuxR family protein